MGDDPLTLAYHRTIEVPFPPESSASGIGVDTCEEPRYRRRFACQPQPGRRVLVHFEGVDDTARVWVDGQCVGEHRGGYIPFTLDITDDLVPEGTEAFTVTLSDPTDAVITKAVGTGTIVDDDLPPFDIIWTNGGSVVLGSAAAPTVFNVGTNAAVPAGVAWTGETASDNWSQAGNWATSSPP